MTYVHVPPATDEGSTVTSDTTGSSGAAEPGAFERVNTVAQHDYMARRTAVVMDQ
ncbi:MAG: hypothetical protein AAGF11_25860 [Myxococcota bacterium]